MILTGPEAVHLFKYLRAFFPKEIELLYNGGSCIKDLKEHVTLEEVEDYKGGYRILCEDDIEVDWDMDQRIACKTAIKEAISRGHVSVDESEVIKPLLEKLDK